MWIFKNNAATANFDLPFIKITRRLVLSIPIIHISLIVLKRGAGGGGFVQLVLSIPYI